VLGFAEAAPEPGGCALFEADRTGEFFISALTLGELQQGVELARHVVTRNVSDFVPLGVEVASPWES